MKIALRIIFCILALAFALIILISGLADVLTENRKPLQLLVSASSFIYAIMIVGALVSSFWVSGKWLTQFTKIVSGVIFVICLIAMLISGAFTGTTLASIVLLGFYMISAYMLVHANSKAAGSRNA